MDFAKILVILKTVIDLISKIWGKKNSPVLESQPERGIDTLELPAADIAEIVNALTVEEVRVLKSEELQAELKKRLDAGYKWSDVEPIIISGLMPSLGPDRAFKRAQKLKARLGL